MGEAPSEPVAIVARSPGYHRHLVKITAVPSLF